MTGGWPGQPQGQTALAQWLAPRPVPPKRGPILGIGNFTRELVSIPSGLSMLARALLPGKKLGEDDAEVVSSFLKGMAQSGLSTATSLIDMPFGGFLPSGGLKPVTRAVGALIPGEEMDPKTFGERAFGEEGRGILSTAFEDIGNVAMVAGGVGAVAKPLTGARGVVQAANAAEAMGRVAQAGAYAGKIGPRPALIPKGITYSEFARAAPAAGKVEGAISPLTGGQKVAFAAERLRTPLRSYGLPKGRNLLEKFPATEKFVQAYDLGREYKRYTGYAQAEARRGFRAVQNAFGAVRMKRFIDNTPGLTQEQRSNLLGEAVMRKATIGEGNVPGQAEVVQAAERLAPTPKPGGPPLPDKQNPLSIHVAAELPEVTAADDIRFLGPDGKFRGATPEMVERHRASGGPGSLIGIAHGDVWHYLGVPQEQGQAAGNLHVRVSSVKRGPNAGETAVGVTNESLKNLTPDQIDALAHKVEAEKAHAFNIDLGPGAETGAVGEVSVRINKAPGERVTGNEVRKALRQYAGEATPPGPDLSKLDVPDLQSHLTSYREFNALTPELQAEVLRAFSDPDIAAGLDEAAVAFAKHRKEHLETLRRSPIGEKGLESDFLEGTEPILTTRQRKRMAHAEKLLGQAFEAETKGLKKAIHLTQGRVYNLEIAKLRVQRHIAKLEARIPEKVTLPISKKTGPKTIDPTWETAERKLFRDVERLESAQKQLEEIDGEILRYQEALATPETLGPTGYGQLLREEAKKITDEILQKNKTPNVAQVNPKFQPLTHEMHQVRGVFHDALKKMGVPEENITAILEEAGLTFQKVVARAADADFDPVHIRQFLPSQVKSMTQSALTFGPKLRIAGTRVARAGQLIKKADHSLEALAAQFTEVGLEVHSAAFFDWLTKAGIAVTVPPEFKGTGRMPPGFVPFVPTHRAIRSIMAGLDLDVGDLLGPESGNLMIPKVVNDYLRFLSKDYNSWPFQQLNRITSPWRASVLTLSPKWYVNNAIGNIIMATAHGVRFQDWAKAWSQKNFKMSELFGPQFLERFEGTDPRLLRLGLAGEAQIETTAGGLLPSTGKLAAREAKVVGKKGVVGQQTARAAEWSEKLQRMNQFVDELARVAVDESSVRRYRKMGLADEAARVRALDDAEEALVNYSNLTPFERQFVRAFIPFYAWQKGILRVMTRLAIDHPARVRMTMMLGEVNNSLLREENDNLPAIYQGLVPAFGKFLHTRRLNPFADSMEILNPDAIAQSINPFMMLGGRRLLDAPEGGVAAFGEKRLSPYGTAVPRVDVLGGLLGTFSDTPLGLVSRSLLPGEAERETGTGEAVTRFLGPTFISPQRIAAAKDRQVRAIEQIATGAPIPPRAEDPNKGFTVALPRTFGSARRRPTFGSRFTSSLALDRRRFGG